MASASGRLQAVTALIRFMTKIVESGYDYVSLLGLTEFVSVSLEDIGKSEGLSPDVYAMLGDAADAMNADMPQPKAVRPALTLVPKGLNEYQILDEPAE